MGDTVVAAPDLGAAVATGGVVGSGAAVAGAGGSVGSVACGAVVAGEPVGTVVAAGSPPPQAMRNRDTVSTARMNVRVSGNPGIRWVERSMWDPLQQEMSSCLGRSPRRAAGGHDGLTLLTRRRTQDDPWMNDLSVWDDTAGSGEAKETQRHQNSGSNRTPGNARGEKEQEETLLLPEGMGTCGGNRTHPTHQEAGELLPKGHRHSPALLQTGRCHPPILPYEPAPLQTRYPHPYLSPTPARLETTGGRASMTRPPFNLEQPGYN